MDLQQTIDYIASNMSTKANCFWPGTQGYIQVTTSYYWLSSEQSPACVFQPAIPQDVAIILTALSKAQDDVLFAIKGGGHIAPPGFNSTSGILIDMALFYQVDYHEDTQLVDVGPGLYWERVYDVLSKLQPPRNVAGATTCKLVGVPGFNLGGGYSNKTNQFGLAIDSIQAIEVVLPSGDILTVDAQNYDDLFFALKGGGNNFGIVTKWSMITHPQGPIWSHTLQYDPQYFGQVINAIIDFQKHENSLCNVEAIFEHTLDNGQPVTIAQVECFYDGETPPQGIFDDFFVIPHTEVMSSKTWMDRHYSLPRNRQSYRVGLGSGKDDLPAFRGRFSCVMVSSYTKDLIQSALDVTSAYAMKLAAYGGLQIYVDIWPFLSTMFDNSTPGAWPHEKGQPNGPLVINFKWLNETDDDYWLNAITTVTATLEANALGQGLTTKNTPVYYNLALGDIPVTSIYRDNYQQLSEVRSKYDPNKLMDRTGGFRIEF